MGVIRKFCAKIDYNFNMSSVLPKNIVGGYKRCSE